MNCQSFEAAVIDLARDQMMEASARNRALAHAVTCEMCSARLVDEQALTAGLRKFAETREDAPARVEGSLRDAFRAMTAAPAEPVITRTESGSRSWLRWAAAAAVIVLVALLALTAARVRKGQTQDVKQETAGPKTEQPAGVPGGVDPKPDVAPLQLAGLHHTQRVSGHQVVRRSRRDPSTKEAKPVEGSEARTEVATEFIPLVHGDEMSPYDGGQLVRVEMPRSALMAFGFPMNMERAGERVKADVVVGNDGLARAIRFVH
ncbi:MAG: hypothetical protein AABO41_01765 [Acidobacteriota bacterium]